jgi:hypothetical protein
MKRQPTDLTPQLNLGLGQQERAKVRSGEERELELALAELLLRAAEKVAKTVTQARGGKDESKTDS